VRHFSGQSANYSMPLLIRRRKFLQMTNMLIFHSSFLPPQKIKKARANNLLRVSGSLVSERKTLWGTPWLHSFRTNFLILCSFVFLNFVLNRPCHEFILRLRMTLWPIPVSHTTTVCPIYFEWSGFLGISWMESAGLLLYSIHPTINQERISLSVISVPTITTTATCSAYHQKNTGLPQCLPRKSTNFPHFLLSIRYHFMPQI
jgi:hypothetical protein